MLTATKMSSAAVGVASVRPAPRSILSAGQPPMISVRGERCLGSFGNLEACRKPLAATSVVVKAAAGGGFEDAPPLDLSQEVNSLDFSDEGQEGAEQEGQAYEPPTKIPFDDVILGDIYEARVLNIVQFGVFVDIGCELDALVHISQVKNAFVEDVNDYLTPGEIVQVKIIDKDAERRRIGASIKQAGFALNRKPREY